MRIVTATVKKTAWFEIEGDKDGSRFELTLLTPGQEREIASKAQRVTFKGGSEGGGMEIDPVLADSLRVQMALTNWDNVYEDEAAAKVFNFSNAHKMQMLNGARIDTADGVVDLQAWLLGKYTILKDEYEAEKEKERKNSAS